MWNRYQVIVHKKVLNNIVKLPLQIQKKIKYLIMDLQNKGAFQSNWAKGISFFTVTRTLKRGLKDYRPK